MESSGGHWTERTSIWREDFYGRWERLVCTLKGKNQWGTKCVPGSSAPGGSTVLLLTWVRIADACC
jgi:hypothetical protein